MEAKVVLQNKAAQVEKEILILAKEIEEKGQSAEAYRREIIKLKEGDFETKKEAIREKMIGFRRAFYEVEIFSRLHERYMMSFLDVLDLLALSEEPVDLPDDLQKTVDFFKKRLEVPIIIDLKTETVVLKDADDYKLNMNNFVGKQESDEELLKALNSPFFTQK